MELRRARDDSSAARRRLELLGRQLAADRGDRPPVDPSGHDDVEPGPTGRHRAEGLRRGEQMSAGLHDKMSPRWQSVFGHGLTIHHVVVLVAIVAAMACGTAWFIISSGPSAVTPVSAPALPPSTPTSPAVSGSSARGPTSGATSTQVVVDVTGKVRKPGIVALPTGSRVAAALQAAGGPRTGTDLSSVNLARVLVDGEQIVVGLPAAAAPQLPGSSAAGPAGTTPGAMVNLNTATSEQLDELPGVGPVTAKAILDWRTEHGRFTTVEELLEVDGIGDATLADLRDLVTV